MFRTAYSCCFYSVRLGTFYRIPELREEKYGWKATLSFNFFGLFIIVLVISHEIEPFPTLLSHHVELLTENIRELLFWLIQCQVIRQCAAVPRGGRFLSCSDWSCWVGKFQSSSVVSRGLSPTQICNFFFRWLNPPGLGFFRSAEKWQIWTREGRMWYSC